MVRREIQGRVYFLYSDDLNNPSTEQNIKQLISQRTCPTFYPTTAKWINCRSSTYYPHSNECGPRSLLAISIMMLHPHPSETILLEYMDPNLAQITRTWVATTILTGQPLIPLIYQEEKSQASYHVEAVSQPYTLIDWTTINNKTSHSSTAPISIHLSQPSASRDPFHVSPRQASGNKDAGILPTNAGSVSAPTANIPRQPNQTTGGSNYPAIQQKITSYLLPSTSAPVSRQERKIKNSTIQPIINQPTSQRVPKTKRTRRRFLTDFTANQPSSPSFYEMEETWGHALESIDTSDTLRVVLQNPNGLKTYRYNGELLLNLQTCNSIGVGVMSLPETNTNWSNTSNIKILQKTLKTIWKHSAYQTSTSSERYTSDYQPGGTVTIAVDHWVSRLTEKGVDPYGLG